MSVFRRMSALAVVCLASFSAAQLSDQIAAAHILGPRWRQVSRSAGMIFSGTVLGIEAAPIGKGHPLPLIVTKFRVDRAIVGVRSGEVLTVREWEGAWTAHRSMRGGARMLIFLYPASRLGLTSPVGGPLGQVTLDSRGEIFHDRVFEFGPRIRLPRGSMVTAASGAEVQFQRESNTALKRCSTQSPASVSTLPPDCVPTAQPAITWTQLERAIRNARRNLAATDKE